jgi:hypothetical protein
MSSQRRRPVWRLGVAKSSDAKSGTALVIMCVASEAAARYRGDGPGKYYLLFYPLLAAQGRLFVL